MSIQNHLYNLLMSSNETAWIGTSWAIEYDRVFEYTHQQVKAHFEKLDDAALEGLMSLPTLFAYEQFLGAPVLVGRITAIARRQKGFAITFNLDNSVAPISCERFRQCKALK